MKPPSVPTPAPQGSKRAIEQEVLARITPTSEDERELQAVVGRLVAGCDQALADLHLDAKATIQGSVAKGTWLRGGGDIDLFLLVEPGLPLERLEQMALEVGPKVLESCQKRYAQHPYLTGSFEGHAVDLVPAYRVASAAARMSAVDRTPFHTAWVRANLDAARTADVRLLKQWMKGTGIYGAQTALGGFSGYLAEVLLVHHGSFAATVSWLAGGAQPRRIALGLDAVTDEVSALVVADPVDPARNCAAAVQAGTLQLASEAAQSYQAAPSISHFFPAAPRGESAQILHEALGKQQASWIGLALRPRTPRLDIVFPQFQKATRSIETALTQAGFEVRRLQALATPAEEEVLLQWITSAAPLPPSRLHRGPPDDGRSNAQRFREKWSGHKDALTPVAAGPEGFLEVELAIRCRTPAEWLRVNLPSVAVGRHVEEAMAKHVKWEDPALVTPQWEADVADFVLDRRSWQR